MNPDAEHRLLELINELDYWGKKNHYAVYLRVGESLTEATRGVLSPTDIPPVFIEAFEKEGK